VGRVAYHSWTGDIAAAKRAQTDVFIDVGAMFVPYVSANVVKLRHVKSLDVALETVDTGHDIVASTKVAGKGTGPYRKTGGHHVHAKAAFKNQMSYNPQSGFSISQDFMKKHGLQHHAMTRYQQKAFKELAQSGRPNTLREHTRIAIEALQAGGASKEMARSLTAQSLNALRKNGVLSPSNIPWNK